MYQIGFKTSKLIGTYLFFDLSPGEELNLLSNQKDFKKKESYAHYGILSIFSANSSGSLSHEPAALPTAKQNIKQTLEYSFSNGTSFPKVTALA